MRDFDPCRSLRDPSPDRAAARQAFAKVAAAALVGLTLAACDRDPACLEYDTAVAERAFTACTSHTTTWNNNTPDRCRDAAKAVSCKRRAFAPSVSGSASA